MKPRDADDGWAIEQKIALITELADVTRLLELGVWSVHQLSGSNDFNHGVLQFLSQGFERLLKCTVLIGLRARGLPMPTSKEMRTKYGHDVVKLHDAVVELASDCEDYTCRDVVKEDLEFMRNDADLQRLLQLFAAFGSKDRYYDLEVILDPSKADPDLEPSRIWSEIETDFLTRRPGLLERIGDIPPDELHAQINSDVAFVLDRYFRALTRMWFLGALGPSGPEYASGALSNITRLYDEQLGVPRSPASGS